MSSSSARRRKPTSGGTRAAIYVRISQDRDGEGAGVQRQREDCQALVDRMGWTVVKVYEDDDVSASTRSRKPRPAYQAMIAAARAGEVDRIVAYSSSRITRRMRELDDLIDLTEQTGVTIHTVA